MLRIDTCLVVKKKERKSNRVTTLFFFFILAVIKCQRDNEIIICGRRVIEKIEKKKSTLIDHRH